MTMRFYDGGAKTQSFKNYTLHLSSMRKLVQGQAQMLRLMSSMLCVSNADVAISWVQRAIVPNCWVARVRI